MSISVHHGLGRHNRSLTPSEEQLAVQFLYFSQPPFAWALVFWGLPIMQPGASGTTAFSLAPPSRDAIATINVTCVSDHAI